MSIAGITVSNIAWDSSEDVAVAKLLAARGICGIEVAPSRLFVNPMNVTPAEVRTARQFWDAYGVRLRSMQSLLYGRPDLLIFGSRQERSQTAAYLSRIIELASELGCGPLVFGSPGNRKRGKLGFEDAFAIAVEFFSSLAEFACERGTVICFEPNAEGYGCDFVTRVREGAALVSAVDHPGFRLHLDSGNIMMANETIEDVKGSLALVAHFQASAPHLGHLIDAETILSALVGEALASGYAGDIAIEMRRPQDGNSLPAIADALDVVSRAIASNR